MMNTNGYAVAVDGQITEYGDGPNAFSQSIRQANRYSIAMADSNGLSTHEVLWMENGQVITHTPKGRRVRGNG